LAALQRGDAAKRRTATTQSDTVIFGLGLFIT